MDTFDCIATKLEIREKILEAARLTGTGLNTQHWRFIVVEDKDNLSKLAEDSTSGKWVATANFAIIILTNPKYNYHMIDAGRALQSMQLAAWNFGIGFGYPAKNNLTGKRKNRIPITELVHYEIYR